MTRRSFFHAKLAGLFAFKLTGTVAPDRTPQPERLPRAKWIEHGLIDAGGNHEPNTFVVRRGGQRLDAYQSYQRAQSEEVILLGLR